MQIDSLWIMTTIGFGIATGILLITLIAVLYFAKKEGRFFMGRGFGGAGVDLIRHEPLNNRLSLHTLKRSGDVWKLGKEYMFFGLDKIMTPENPKEKSYNRLISESSTWDGSKRPAVIATDVLSFTVTPALHASIAKAENVEKYKEACTTLGKIFKYLEAEKTQVVSFLEIIHPDDMKKYLKDLGPKKMREMFLKGVEAQKLASTKPPTERLNLGGIWIYLVFMAIALIGIYWLFTSGTLEGLL